MAPALLRLAQRTQNAYDVDSVQVEAALDLTLVLQSLKSLCEFARTQEIYCTERTAGDQLAASDQIAALAARLIPLMRSLALHTKNSIAATVHFKDDDMLQTLVLTMEIFARVIRELHASDRVLFGSALSGSVGPSSDSDSSADREPAIQPSLSPLSLSRQQLQTCVALHQGMLNVVSVFEQSVKLCISVLIDNNRSDIHPLLTWAVRVASAFREYMGLLREVQGSGSAASGSAAGSAYTDTDTSADATGSALSDTADSALTGSAHAEHKFSAHTLTAATDFTGPACSSAASDSTDLHLL